MLRRFLPATITFAFSLIILTSGLTQVQEFRVTDASLKPLEPKSDGPCPVTVRFSGSITTNGPGTVKYTFTRSDGATASVSILEFKAAGTQSVSTDWTLGVAQTPLAFDGWQTITILSPNEFESSREAGAFSIRCGQPSQPPPNRDAPDLMGVLASAGEFKTLRSGLQNLRIQDLLRGKSAYTFFAPTDRAFEKMPKERLDALMSNPRYFKDFILRHLVAGKHPSADLASGKVPVLTSIAGQSIAVVANQQVKPARIVLDRASTIVNADLFASNSIVHAIDAPFASSSEPVDIMPRSAFDGKYSGRSARAAEIVARYRDPAGVIRPDLLQRGIEAAQRLPVFDVRAASLTPQGDSREIFVKASYAMQAAQWTEIGPKPLIERSSGRVDSGEATSIAIDPRGTRNNVIYLATHAGGIWKTTDGGLSWMPKTDTMPSLSTGAVALDPASPSTVYAGTCSPFDGVGITLAKCRGIYKSTNGGDNWTIKGAAIFGAPAVMPGTAPSPGATIFQMALPSANVLLVATNQGLYRSIDGGDNFGANSPGYNDGQPLVNGTFAGVAVDTSDPRVVYAMQSGTGILKSTDGGMTFSENLFVNPDGTPKPNAPIPGQHGYISFSQSTRPNNQTLYASVDNGNGIFLDLFKSTDGGATWTTPSTNARTFAMCMYCYFGAYANVVAVDPRDANRVFLGFVNIHYSTDGGMNFGAASPWAEIHPDHRAIVFSPLSHTDNGQNNPPATDVLVGNDGGIYGGSLRGLSYWRSLNAKIGTNLITQVGMGNNEEGKPAYAGLWDHGAASNETRPLFVGTSNTTWAQYQLGDGGAVAVDPDDPYNCFQLGNFGLIRTADGGRTMAALPVTFPANISRLGIAGRRSFPGADPDSRVFIAGHIYTSPGAQLFQDETLINTFSNSVFQIAAASPPRLWVSLWDNGVTTTGNVLTMNTAGGFTDFGVLGSAGVNGGKFAHIAVDPNNQDTVCVAYDGFTLRGAPGSSEHIFLTTNNGGIWTDISGDFPDVPIHDVIFDPNTRPRSIIIATAAGVFRTSNPGSGANWQILARGLPPVDCMSLALFSDTRQTRLRVGTWGRSVWELVYGH